MKQRKPMDTTELERELQAFIAKAYAVPTDNCSGIMQLVDSILDASIELKTDEMIITLAALLDMFIKTRTMENEIAKCHLN